MKVGDRVKVIGQDSEWVGLHGVMSGMFLNGTVAVVLDRSAWEVSFEPHDLELEESSGEAEGSTPTPLD